MSVQTRNLDDIREDVYKYMFKEKVSASTIADRLGISRSTLSHFLNGTRHTMRKHNLIGLCEALQIDYKPQDDTTEISEVTP